MGSGRVDYNGDQTARVGLGSPQAQVGAPWWSLRRLGICPNSPGLSWLILAPPTKDRKKTKMHALPWTMQKFTGTQLELYTIKEIRSINIEKDNICDNMVIYIWNS